MEKRCSFILVYSIGIFAAVRDWVKDSRFDGLVLSIPEAEDQSNPLFISISSLHYLYLSESGYAIDVLHSNLTKLYLTCSSRHVNFIAKWLVHLKDFRIRKLRVTEPFDESLKMKQLVHLYIGRISEDSEVMAGEYLVKLVTACPKVCPKSHVNKVVESFCVVECLEWWSDGCGNRVSCILFSCKHRARNATSLKLVNFKTTRILNISIICQPHPLSQAGCLVSIW
jgi:hypothetical protein